MGEEIMHAEERNPRLFNTPVEMGLRLLTIVEKFANHALSLEMLVYLDYFLIHSSDLKGPLSLHPKYPFRSSELVIKRAIVQQAIALLLSKELLQVELRSDGIFYRRTAVGGYIVSNLKSTYAEKLLEIGGWLHERFQNATESSLADIVNTHIEKWGGEFTNESKFRSYSE